MNILSAENLTKSYGVKILFEEMTFGLAKGQKAAMIGRNGCGKTSLLKILSGKDSPDSGNVSIRRETRVEYLDQDPQFEPGLTVLEAVFDSSNPSLQLIRQYEAISTQANPDAKALQEIVDKMELHQAWDAEAKVKEILGKLGVHQLNQSVETLSGGQRKRIALARVLIAEPDLLVLDEPTNHLDVEGIEWLEGYLSNANLTLLLVTHDRYFLDRVCNTILELEEGKMYVHDGNYSYFLEKKAEREAAQDKVVDRANNLLRKELEWLRRQPKARTTKSKARIDAAHQLQEDASQTRTETSLNMNFASRRLGKKILELDKISKAYGNKVILSGFEYTFKRQERIGIVGHNGVGKTTFLDLITGKQQPDSGTIDTGETIQFGYYTQAGLHFKDDQVVLDVIKDVAEYITLANGDQVSVSQMLNLFGFPPKVQYTPVGRLSGGEKRRLHLLRVLIEQPNFLILDEPTNDLDIITLNTLEEYLEGFGGCLVIVSHDRYFLDKLADTLLVFEGDGMVVNYPGNYRQYREWRREKDAAEAMQKEAEAKNAQERNWRDQGKRKLTFNEKREFEALEKEVPELEEKIASLQEKINAGGSDFESIAGWMKELEAMETSLETKSDRWLELAEFAE